MNTDKFQFSPNNFEEIIDCLSPSERANFRLLLCLAAGKGSELNEGTPDPIKVAAMECTRDLVSKLGYGSFIWRGQLPFLDRDLLFGLYEEAQEARKHATRLGNHLFSVAKGRALSVSQSSELQSFVKSIGLSTSSSGVASLVYYDRPGDRLEPHVDTDNFSVNILIMLKHEWKESPSHLVLHLASGPRRLLLDAGDTVVFDAGSIVHAREPIGYGESITLLTIGMTRDEVNR